MSKNPWTPGPWREFIFGNTVQVGVPSNPGKNPCIVHWSGFDASDRSLVKQIGNARLIAAAPEMAELLERWLAWVDSGEHGYPSEERLNVAATGSRALLARIKGETT